MQDPVLKKQQRLQEIRDLKARLWRRITRSVNAFDKLNDEEKRILRPRKLEPHERDSSKAITGRDLHKIHDPEFFDDSDVLGTL